MASHSGFDKLAPIYRLMENLVAGNLMQQARTAHTNGVTEAKNVLMLGEGPGRLLEHLLHTLPSARFMVMDQSQAMLNQAKNRLQNNLSHCSRITWIRQDILTQGIPDGPYDLITTPFFLDCFTRKQLEKLIPSIASSSSQHSDWLLTDFQIPANGRFKRWRAKSIHRLMYMFFRILTGIGAKQVEEPDILLQAAGFRKLKREEFNFGLIRSDHWRRELKDQ